MTPNPVYAEMMIAPPVRTAAARRQQAGTKEKAEGGREAKTAGRANVRDPGSATFFAVAGARFDNALTGQTRKYRRRFEIAVWPQTLPAATRVFASVDTRAVLLTPTAVGTRSAD